MFFFKQKTAYEMRISDWSSDVCSSDLAGQHSALRGPVDQPQRRPQVAGCEARLLRAGHRFHNRRHRPGSAACVEGLHRAHRVDSDLAAELLAGFLSQERGHRLRSEEHTSELQSLMRISYAVFCLKKT